MSKKVWVAVGFDARDLGKIEAHTRLHAYFLALQRFGVRLAYVERSPSKPKPRRKK